METKVRIDAGRLWAAGVATSMIAAVAALVVYLFAEGVFDVDLRVEDLGGGGRTDLTWVPVVGVSFLAGILATAVLHAFLLFVPRPTVFFGWLAVLATAAACLVPLTMDVSNEVMYWLLGMYVVVGVVVISLLLAITRWVVVEEPRLTEPAAPSQAPPPPPTQPIA
ncbi:MAG: DUF6069 family protein [Actinomycetota bacterium]